MKEDSKPTESNGLTRRDALKVSGLALGGLALGGGLLRARSDEAHAAEACPEMGSCYPTATDTQRYSYFFDTLDTFDPIDPETRMYKLPEPNEMRITFLGSCIPPVRRAQQMMSVFVEVGNAKGKPDQFLFDCGSGVCANYGAMGISFGRMDKVFLAHLHGDHMSDLTHIYCFGPSADRKSPLYVWGPGRSGVRNPKAPHQLYDDGTHAFCAHLRQALRWHSESFSFQTTSYASYQPPTRKSWGLPVHPVPVGGDSPKDGFALVPIELNWRKYGQREGDNVAYDNPETGVKITHFPVIHCRKGSIGYKLEWNGLSMIYTSDTKPEIRSRDQAINGGNGVDVLIHEMVIPAEVWAMKNMGLSQPGSGATWEAAVDELKMVQNSSHTPQGAFGYLLSQINPKPRLTVATHFPVADDTVDCALRSVQAHWPEAVMDKDNGNLTWSFDLMVLRAFAGDPKPKIQQLRGVVSDYGFSPVFTLPPDQNTPKYWMYEVDADGNPVYDENGKRVKVGDPYAQIDQETEIPPTDEEGNCNYRDDGY